MKAVLEFMRHLLYLPPGASSMSDDIDWLHIFVIATTMVVATFVFAAALLFTFRSKRTAPPTQRLAASVPREWGLVVFILATFVLWWLIGYRQYVELREPPKDAMVIHVTAKQWMWKFSYENGRDTNDDLYVPVDRPVELVMISRDVIHSFYVPAFRSKLDVLPSQANVMWFRATQIGTFPIYCAELCGVGHSRMLGTVHVLSPEEWDRWDRNSNEPQTSPSMAQAGADVALKRGCVQCHTLDGQPHIGPSFSKLYKSEVKLADGTSVVADEAYLTRSMMEPASEIVGGYRNVMPSYAGILDPTETGALLELIRSLREGHAPSGVILPKVVPVEAGAP